jgi:hypothetical protein
VLGIYTTKDNRPWSLPAELNGVSVVDWTWVHIATFIKSL